MEPDSRRDPLARERARQRRAKQVRRRRLALLACLVGLIVLVVGLAIGLSGDDGTAVVGTSSTTEPEGTTETTEGGETTSTTEPTSATYTAELTGDQSVPPVETQARAELNLMYDKNEGTLSFVLEVTSMITRPNLAAIYEGAPGTSGSAVVTLFAGPEEGTTFEGVLAEGFIDKEDLVGTLQGAELTDLVALLASGNTYVSIGNASHPVDAIRGQIELESLLNTGD